MASLEIALVGAETLTGEAVRKALGSALSYFGSEECDETRLVSTGDMAGIIHPYRVEEIQQATVVLDAADEATRELALRSGMYLYIGAGDPPEGSVLLQEPGEWEGTRHLSHSSLLLLLGVVPLDVLKAVELISLTCSGGASYRGRNARDDLVRETVHLLEFGATDGNHRAFNSAERRGRNRLTSDLRALIGPGGTAMVWEMEMPFFHGAVLNVGMLFPTMKETGMLLHAIGEVKGSDSSFSNLFTSVRDGRIRITRPAVEGRTVTFTLYGDEIVSGTVPAVEEVVSRLR